MSSAIDLNVLETSTGGDRPLARRLLAIWSWKAGDLLGLIDPDSNDEDWAYAAHTLRSAALAVGALTVACKAEEAKRVVGSVTNLYTEREEALVELGKAVEDASLEVSRLLASA